MRFGYLAGALLLVAGGTQAAEPVLMSGDRAAAARSCMCTGRTAAR